MKTTKQIIDQDPVFLHVWEDDGEIGVISDFEDIYITKTEYEAKQCPHMNKEMWIEDKAKMDKALERYKGVNILFASYAMGNYSGDAWVLFEEKGKLYEVNGGHCSCYELEGQWEPEQVVLKELKNRLINGEFGIDDWSGNEFAKELKEFLDIT